MVYWFKDREGLAAIATLAVIVVAIVIPAMFISASIFSEAVGLYNSITLNGGDAEVSNIFFNGSWSSNHGNNGITLKGNNLSGVQWNGGTIRGSKNNGVNFIRWKPLFSNSKQRHVYGRRKG